MSQMAGGKMASVDQRRVGRSLKVAARRSQLCVAAARGALRVRNWVHPGASREIEAASQVHDLSACAYLACGGRLKRWQHPQSAPRSYWSVHDATWMTRGAAVRVPLPIDGSARRRFPDIARRITISCSSARGFTCEMPVRYWSRPKKAISEPTCLSQKALG